jgi:cytoskeletal protein CcmA (bactofilin family)
VNGNVHYRVLQIEPGASVNGQLIHESAEGVQALTHQKLDSLKSDAVLEFDGARHGKTG